MENLKVQKAERYFFAFATLVNLIPVLLNKFLPTLDGAAHLYNSNLISHLLVQDSGILSNYFIFNNEAVPNWTGHIILTFFNSFFPAFIAEKFLLLFYFVGMPYSFRVLVKTIAPQNMLCSYLIFPFTYSYLFLLGFYNFSLAFIFMFLSLSYWLSNENQGWRIKNYIHFFLLITLTYFSHIFVFGMTLFFIGIQTLTKGIQDFLENNDFQSVLKNMFKKAGVILVSAMFPIILLVQYFSKRPSGNTPEFLEKSQLIEWISTIRPIMTYNLIDESRYTQKLVYILLFMIAVVLITKVLRIVKSSFNLKTFFTLIDGWFISLFFIVLLYFKLPNGDGSAGFVSDRLCLLFFIVLIIWISFQEMPKWVVTIAIAAVLFVNCGRLIYYVPIFNALGSVAKECNTVSESIAPNSVVLPLNYSDHWLHGHFSNYLGIDKPTAILENYEASTGYFPLLWNDFQVPNHVLGKGNSKPLCFDWKKNINNLPAAIDYVFILGDFQNRNDSCSLLLKDNLLNNYVIKYQSNICQLYQIK